MAITKEERRRRHALQERERRARNPEKFKAEVTAYRTRNKDRINAYQRERRARQHSSVIADQRQYYSENKEKINQQRRSRNSKNREAINKRQNEKRALNKDVINAKHRPLEIKRYEKIMKSLIELKESTPCADCGNFYPYYVMDFDHVRGEKLACIGHIKKGSIKKLRDEIAKTELVCSNCHRARTYARNQHGKGVARVDAPNKESSVSQLSLFNQAAG